MSRPLNREEDKALWIRVRLAGIAAMTVRGLTRREATRVKKDLAREYERLLDHQPPMTRQKYRMRLMAMR